MSLLFRKGSKMTETRQLVLFDADRIKDFVFATGRLKEIRGASQLVRDTTNADALLDIPQLTREQIIFAEGGSGLLEASDAVTAAEICRALTERYHRLTAGATLTAVHTPYTDATFRDDMQRAARRLQLAKETTIGLQHTVQTPFTALCASCGAHPVTDHYSTGTNTEPLCQRCIAKRKKSDELRTRSQLGEDIYLDETGWGKKFLAKLSIEAFQRWENSRLPENLTALAALSRPGNYLALLYADGNGLGELVQQQTSKAGYKALSDRISKALHNALWHALKQHFSEPRGPEHHVPFELIALGGDDLILITVADRALPLALTLSRLFTEYSRPDASVTGTDITHNAAGAAPDNAGLTLSFGVVIAHPGQPILNLEQQARNLLRNAKRRYPGQAAIDFHIVSTPILHDIDQIRNEAYTLKQNGITIAHLTSRPLLLNDLWVLLDHTLRFQTGGEDAAVPRNKLHALYQAIFAGEAAAEQEAFFLRSRLNSAQWAKFDAFFAKYKITQCSQVSAGAALPWGQGDDALYTPFVDLVELYPFVHPELASVIQREEPLHAVED
jgi:hypothetical protein